MPRDGKKWDAWGFFLIFAVWIVAQAWLGPRGGNST
jgi:hypothetical protein